MQQLDTQRRTVLKSLDNTKFIFLESVPSGRFSFKFKTIQSYRSALLSTKEELSIGFLLLLFTVLAFVVFPYQGLSLMLLIGLAYVALGYFAAPLMAVIGVWSFKREDENQLAIHHGAAE